MQKSEFPKMHHYVGFWQIGSHLRLQYITYSNILPKPSSDETYPFLSKPSILSKSESSPSSADNSQSLIPTNKL